MGALYLNTIYPAFMGEVNIHGIGALCTFVRLAGCNLRCYYKTKGTLCDTPEALTFLGGKEVSVDHIVDEVKRHRNEVVCLTGGEPLVQDVTELLSKLSSCGHFVVVETNGSKSIRPYRQFRNVSFVVDVKSKSSGEHLKMLETNYSLLGENDFVKFVIDTEEDYEEFQFWVTSHPYLKCKVAVGLFWGSKVSYEWLISKLSTLICRHQIYLNMQAHKMSCLYDHHKESLDKIFIPKEL